MQFFFASMDSEKWHRYYDRQFATRTNLSADHVSNFEEILRVYYENKQQLESGIPSVSECGIAMNMSGRYLSDLLKAETGKSLMEHVHLYIIEIVKNSLLSFGLPICEIAYSLGFDYPQHFSKLFKSKTGFSPSQFRNLN